MHNIERVIVMFQAEGKLSEYEQFRVVYRASEKWKPPTSSNSKLNQNLFYQTAFLVRKTDTHRQLCGGGLFTWNIRMTECFDRPRIHT